MPTDPVCHKRVDTDTPFRTSVNGHTYYFCSEDCADEFTENMDEYLEMEEASAPKYTEE